MHRPHAILAFLVLVAAGAMTLAETPTVPPRSGIDVKGMDPSVKPYEDFYQYANGKWLETATIPADRPNIAMFTLLQDQNRKVLREIAEEAAKARQGKDGIKALVGAFYHSGM